MTDTEGWTAFYVKEENSVGIYDIYDDADEWVAQVRFDRRKGSDVYILFSRHEGIAEPLKNIKGRDAWRQWLIEHKGQL